MANYYVTTTGAGTKSGADWANAFDWAAFETYSVASATSLDRYYLEGGTYTLTSAYSNTHDDIYDRMIAIIGVTAGTTNEPPLPSDHATGDGRPLIECGSDSFTVDDGWSLRNIRLTSSNASCALKMGHGSTVMNCKVENTNASATYCLDIYKGFIFDSEIIGDSGTLIEFYLEPGVVSHCYLHGSASIGIAGGNCSGNSLTHNIINGPDIAITASSGAGRLIAHNTIYGAATYGIQISASGYHVVINNIICNCGIGIYGLEYQTRWRPLYVDYNNYYNNTTDVSNITKGPNALSVDPGFTDAANGDFSLASSSGLIGAGFGMRLGVS